MISTVRLDVELLIVASGIVDGRVAPHLYHELSTQIDDGARRVVLDLTDAEEFDDGAVAVLAAVTMTLLRRGGSLFVTLDPERTVEVHDASLLRSVLES